MTQSFGILLKLSCRIIHILFMLISSFAVRMIHLHFKVCFIGKQTNNSIDHYFYSHNYIVKANSVEKIFVQYNLTDWMRSLF